MTPPWQHGRRIVPLVIALLIPVLVAGKSGAEETPDGRRASVVYNLSKFVVWPPEKGGGSPSPSTFCLLGKDSIAGDLMARCEEGGGETADLFRRIHRPDEARGCHLLFIGRVMAPTLSAVLDRLDTHPLLTVSDIPGFARQGGMVEIVSADDRVGFHINLDAAKRAGLSIKAPLLQIAKVIRNGDASP